MQISGSWQPLHVILSVGLPVNIIFTIMHDCPCSLSAPLWLVHSCRNAGSLVLRPLRPPLQCTLVQSEGDPSPGQGGAQGVG